MASSYVGDLHSKSLAGNLRLDLTSPLIVAKVKIDLTTIVKDVDFSMLVRGKGSGIDVQVRVDLDGGHGDVAGL